MSLPDLYFRKDPTMNPSEPRRVNSTEPAEQPHHLIPAQVTWPSIEGFQVIANEDGVHLKAHRETMIEPADLSKLLEVVEAARAAYEAGTVSTPTPPDPATLDRWDYENRAKVAARAAARGIRETYGLHTETPF